MLSNKRIFDNICSASMPLTAGLVLAVSGVASALAYTESTSCSPFSSIGGDPSTTTLGISNNDDVTEFVTLPFVFNWWGDTPINDVRVSTNGQINIDSAIGDSNCCSADPVEVGGSWTSPRIALAQEDLNPGNDAGSNIYTLDTGSSFIVEYAIVPFWPNGGEVNAQVELYPNGDIEMRWGTGNLAGNSIAAGVEDDTRAAPAAVPATGAPFGAGGIASTAYPTGQCRRFVASAPPRGRIEPIPALGTFGLALLATLVGFAGFRALHRESAE